VNERLDRQESRGARFIERGGAYLAANAVLVGDVTLGSECSVWYGSVLRGDDAAIEVGARTNLQDVTVVHPDPEKPIRIGREVTVGHRALLHCVRIGDRSLIGMGAILMEDVEVGAGSLIAAGSVVPPGSIIPPHSLVRGVPARVVRETTAEEREEIVRAAAKYVENAREFIRRFGSV